MIPRAAAEKAAVTYKETQPAIDALKTTKARNEAAKKTLGAYMIEKDLPIFRGVTLELNPREVFDNDRLLAYLGEKAKDLRKTILTRSFGLAKRDTLK